MTRGEAMTRTGWRQALGELARNVMRVVFVYALVLQTLAPLAVARAEARDGLGGHAVVCSAMAGAGAASPAEAPAPIVHDCLSCCLGSVVGVLPIPSGIAEPAGFLLLLASDAPIAVIRPVPAGGPPPQRAPPGDRA